MWMQQNVEFEPFTHSKKYNKICALMFSDPEVPDHDIPQTPPMFQSSILPRSLNFQNPISPEPCVPRPYCMFSNPEVPRTQYFHRPHVSNTPSFQMFWLYVQNFMFPKPCVPSNLQYSMCRTQISQKPMLLKLKHMFPTGPRPLYSLNPMFQCSQELSF